MSIIYILHYGKPMKINNNLAILKLNGFTTYTNPNYMNSKKIKFIVKVFHDVH